MIFRKVALFMTVLMFALGFAGYQYGGLNSALVWFGLAYLYSLGIAIAVDIALAVMRAPAYQRSAP